MKNGLRYTTILPTLSADSRWNSEAPCVLLNRNFGFCSIQHILPYINCIAFHLIRKDWRLVFKQFSFISCATSMLKPFVIFIRKILERLSKAKLAIEWFIWWWAMQEFSSYGILKYIMQKDLHLELIKQSRYLYTPQFQRVLGVPEFSIGTA